MMTILDKEVWRNGAGHLVKDSVQIFGDGSKLGGTVGGEIFSEPIRIAESIRLPDYCSVFQAEVWAIWAEVKILWNRHHTGLHCDELQAGLRLSETPEQDGE